MQRKRGRSSSPTPDYDGTTSSTDADTDSKDAGMSTVKPLSKDRTIRSRSSIVSTLVPPPIVKKLGD